MRYDVPEEDVVQSAAAQRVIADRSLLAIATRYLGTCPVQDLVAMWWSTSRDDGAASAAAQKFHFDLDRLRFLKVFVFLTDVDADTGPHVYVPGSHRDLPWELRVDGRHSDAEVTARLDRPPERISGPRGTIFLADTRGLHKGQPLRRGQRLVFQTEYAVALFGAPFTSPHLAEPTSELLDRRRAHPSVLARFR